MRNYILADLSRIFQRGKRWIQIGIIFLLDVLSFFPTADSTVTGVQNLETLELGLKWLPLIIGFIEIMFVFADDFKGKTAQIAIGIGVSRKKVVLAKWLEMIILALADTLMVIAVAVVLCGLGKAPIPEELYSELVIQGFVCVLSVAAYITPVLPILFMSQGTTLSMLLYMLLSAGLVHKLITLLSKIKLIAAFHLTNYTLTNCLNVLRSRLLLGSLHYESLEGILVVVAAFLFLTVRKYNKLELEF